MKDELLASCSIIGSLRAFRLSFMSDISDAQPEELSDLPNEHVLGADKFPQSLEYVLWEVPWMKRLYRVEREQEVVKMVHTGHDYLPGRPYYPTLTWSNESIFDHIGE